MSSMPPILIAGGGIGGLAAALALDRTGHAVTVLERNAAPSEAGAGIQIGPNGVKALRQLGVADAVRAVAAVPEFLTVRRGRDAAILARAALGGAIEKRCGAPYWVVHRADLHAALDGAAADCVPILRGFDITALARGADTVTATAADGRAIDGQALIGADGIWSRVRSLVMPGATPQPCGTVAYRAVLSLADAGVLAASEVGAWLAPGAHVVHYPVQAGRSINVVVIVDDPWQSMSWNAPADRADVARAVAGFAAPLRAALAGVTGWHKWSLARPMKLNTWVRGRVALLGDAAHPVQPYLAQGGVMALEDAVQLAASLTAHADDLPLGLIRYDAARQTRTRRIQDTSARNGVIFHLSGPAASVRDLTLRALPPSALLMRLTWLYAHNGPTLALPYSAISTGVVM